MVIHQLDTRLIFGRSQDQSLDFLFMVTFPSAHSLEALIDR